MTSEHDGLDSDSDVIAASLSDPALFGELFTRHSASVFRYLAHLTDRNTAEDLLGETFAVAFAARSRYELDRLDARPWLFGVATNVVRHHRRSEHRRATAHRRIRSEPVGTSNEMERATDRLNAAGYQRKVELALGAIPNAYREVLVLIGGMGLSYDETARALGVPLGTVRSRISRARSRLRSLLVDPDLLTSDDRAVNNEPQKEPVGE